MTKIECDICSGPGPVEELRECYQSASVKEVCLGCAERTNKALSGMRVVAQRFVDGSMKAFIARLVEKFRPKA